MRHSKLCYKYNTRIGTDNKPALTAFAIELEYKTKPLNHIQHYIVYIARKTE